MRNIKRTLIFLIVVVAGLGAVTLLMPQIPFYLLLRWQAAQIDNPWVEVIPEAEIVIGQADPGANAGEQRSMGRLLIPIPAGYQAVGRAGMADMLLLQAADGASFALVREQGILQAWPEDMPTWGYQRHEIVPDSMARDEWGLQREIMLTRPSAMSWRDHPEVLLRACVFMLLKAIDAPAPRAHSAARAFWVNSDTFKGVQMGEPEIAPTGSGANGSDLWADSVELLLFTSDNQRYRLIARGQSQARINEFVARLVYR